MKGNDLMEGNIERAARSFGACLVLSSLILVIGLHLSLSSNFRMLGDAVSQAGANSRSTFPSDITLRPVGQVNLAPVRIDLQQSK
jgi:hypothetical protein